MTFCLITVLIVGVIGVCALCFMHCVDTVVMVTLSHW